MTALAGERRRQFSISFQGRTLEHLGVWQGWQPHIVQGEDIGQVLQFVDSGAAEMGLVAYAQVKQRAVGSYWLVPQANHAPLEQQVLLLQRAAKSPGALAFMRYLRSADARRLMEAAGYDVP